MFYGDSRRNDAPDFLKLRVSSPDEMKQKAKDSLIINNGGFFIFSAPGFNCLRDGVNLAQQYKAFEYHFSKKEIADSRDLLRLLEKSLICKRLFNSLSFQKQTYNYDLKVQVSVPIFSNDYVLSFDPYTGVYKMKMPSDKGSVMGNIKAFSEFVMGCFLYNNSVLLKRCTLEKYKEHVDHLMYLYSLDGEESLEQTVDELQIMRTDEDWKRLEGRRGSLSAYEFNKEAKRLNGIYINICNKYRNKNNYLGDWANRFYKGNSFLF